MKMIHKARPPSFLMLLNLHGIQSKGKLKQSKSPKPKSKVDVKSLKLKINQNHHIFH